MSEVIKKLIIKGILKGCNPPVKPYKRNNNVFFKTCQNPLLEEPAKDIVNNPSLNLDDLIFWYFFFKLFK